MRAGVVLDWLDLLLPVEGMHEEKDDADEGRETFADDVRSHQPGVETRQSVSREDNLKDDGRPETCSAPDKLRYEHSGGKQGGKHEVHHWDLKSVLQEMEKRKDNDTDRN